MVIGDAAQAIVQVKWWRPRRRRLDAQRWIRRRMEAARATPDESGACAAPADFSAVGWATDAPLPGQRDARRSLWYGYAPRAGLMLELVVRGDTPRHVQQRVVSRVLPSLEAADREGPTPWALFDASFRSPAGFVITGRRVNLGDLALLFSGRDRTRLLLWQVYPAELALARRDMSTWLDRMPFRERRRIRPWVEPEPWRVQAAGGMLEGRIRRGQKRVAFPLGPLGARRSVAAAVRDPQLDRLLVVEYDVRPDAGDPDVAAVIADMNWAQRQAETTA